MRDTAESMASRLQRQGLGREGNNLVPVSLPECFRPVESFTPYQRRDIQTKLLALSFLLREVGGSVQTFADEHNISAPALRAAIRKIGDACGLSWAMRSDEGSLNMSASARKRWAEKGKAPVSTGGPSENKTYEAQTTDSAPRRQG